MLCAFTSSCVALINVYFITTIGANDDAIKFHRVAMTLAQKSLWIEFWNWGQIFIAPF